MPELEHPTAKELGERLTEIREALGLDRQTVAARAELELELVTAIEAGTRECTFHELKRLAFALGITLTTLTRGW